MKLSPSAASRALTCALLSGVVCVQAVLAQSPPPATAPAAAAGAPAAQQAAKAALPKGIALPRLDRLTEEQLLRLEKVALDKGTSIPVPGPIAAVLHLAPEQVAPLVRQVSFRGDDGTKHGFARLNDGTGFFLFRTVAANDMSVYRLDTNQKVLAAAHNFQGGRLIALPPAEAQVEVDGELAAWSRVLSPKGVSMPRPDGAPAAPVPAAPKP